MTLPWRGGAGRRRRWRGRARRARPEDGSRRDRPGQPGRLDDHALDPRLRTSPAPSIPRSTTPSSRAAASASCWPATWSRRCSAPRPWSSASSSAARCWASSTKRPTGSWRPIGAPGMWSATATSRLATAPASCTSRRPSAKTTCASVATTTCRWSTPSTPPDASRRGRALGPGVRQRRRPGIIADLAPAACCWPRCLTSTATPSAGAATRRCSTTPRRPGT